MKTITRALTLALLAGLLAACAPGPETLGQCEPGVEDLSASAQSVLCM